MKTLASLGYLGGIVDNREQAAKQLAKVYPDVKVFTDYKRAVLEDFAGFCGCDACHQFFIVSRENLGFSIGKF